jgi:hypothetical protein
MNKLYRIYLKDKPVSPWPMLTFATREEAEKAMEAVERNEPAYRSNLRVLADGETFGEEQVKA